MGFELLTEADYVLDACGREVPPEGYRFVDLPRFIPFHVTVSGVGGTGQFVPVTDGLVFQGLVFEVVINVLATFFNQPFSLSVSGSTITVQLAVTAGAVTTTWGALQAALAADPAASALVVTTLFAGTNPAHIAVAFTKTILGTFTTTLPTQERVANNAKTLFLVEGIVFDVDNFNVRVKWPSGRFLAQNISGVVQESGACFPAGLGGNLVTLDEPVPIESGAVITVEISASPGVVPITPYPVNGNVNIQFWGKLRYLLKGNAPNAGGGAVVDGDTCIIGYPAAAKGQKRATCLVGYPNQAWKGEKPGGGYFQFSTMPDPIDYLKGLDRYLCNGNQNIMAPEFRKGNQPTPEIPDGEDDESFTFFSQAIAVKVGDASFGNAVIVPGAYDVVIKRMRATSVWSGGAAVVNGGVPMFAMRLPNGYSVTGGDMIPTSFLYWFPIFPTLRVGHGARIILDVSSALQANNVGTITTTFEFDAVRRKPVK